MSIWLRHRERHADAPTCARRVRADQPADQPQWPKWGQYYETKGAAGEPPDLPEAKRLLELFEQWQDATYDRGSARDLGRDARALHQPVLHDRA